MKKNPKEYEALTEKFFEGIKEKGCDEKFCHYVWDVQIALSRGLTKSYAPLYGDI